MVTFPAMRGAINSQLKNLVQEVEGAVRSTDQHADNSKQKPLAASPIGMRVASGAQPAAGAKFAGCTTHLAGHR